MQNARERFWLRTSIAAAALALGPTNGCTLSLDDPVSGHADGGMDGALVVDGAAPDAATAPPSEGGASDGSTSTTDDAGTPLPPGPLPTFTLKSAIGGTALPFAIGHVFERGRIPAGTGVRLDLTNAQVIPISTWSDGSVRHASVAGLVDLAPNQAKTIAFQSGAMLGTNLDAAAIVAAAPNASVSFGSKGTVDLASLLGTPKIVEHAGPSYVAAQYIGAFPSDASLRAVFYVQLWSGGAYRVRVAVENGHAVQTSAPANGTALVKVAGNTVFQGALSMARAVRWDAVGFKGTDPKIALGVDAAYMRRTKLVPNYGWPQVAPARIQELAQMQYQPLALAGWEADMGAPGFAPAIGLLPHWDAVYACTGNASIHAAVLDEARAYGTYSIYYRDDATGRFPTFSSYPTTSNAEGDTESLQGGGNAYRWEVAHHPNAGYFAWLLTGERYFLEILQANAWAAWFTEHDGNGTARIHRGQTRARAWRFRSIASAAAASPDGDPFKADARANVLANLNYWNDTHAKTNNPGTGLGATYDDQDGASGYQRSLFEHFFLASSIGWAWDFDLWTGATDQTTHRAVRDYFYKVPIGVTGRGPAQGEYSYRRGPGPYRTTVGSGSTEPTIFDDWGAAYQATYGDQLASTIGLSIQESYADDPSNDAFPQGNWAHLITALSMAAEHGTPGASESFTRVTTASNWAANAAKFVYWPQNAVLPRQ